MPTMTPEELSRRVPMMVEVKVYDGAGFIAYASGISTAAWPSIARSMESWRVSGTPSPAWGTAHSVRPADYHHIPPLPEQCPPEIRARGYRTPEDEWQWTGTPWAEPVADPWAVPPEVAAAFYADPRSKGWKVAALCRADDGVVYFTVYRPGSGVMVLGGNPGSEVVHLLGGPLNHAGAMEWRCHDSDRWTFAPEPADFRAAPERSVVEEFTDDIGAGEGLTLSPTCAGVHGSKYRGCPEQTGTVYGRLLHADPDNFDDVERVEWDDGYAQLQASGLKEIRAAALLAKFPPAYEPDIPDATPEEIRSLPDVSER